MYMFFLVDVPGGDAAGILQLFAGAAAASFELAPIRTVLAASYVVVHCIALAAMRWYPSREILPLSAFPMFKNSVDLFDPVRPLPYSVFLPFVKRAAPTLGNCRGHRRAPRLKHARLMLRRCASGTGSLTSRTRQAR